MLRNAFCRGSGSCHQESSLYESSVARGCCLNRNDRILRFVIRLSLLLALPWHCGRQTAFADDTAKGRQTELGQAIEALQKANVALQLTNTTLEKTTRKLQQDVRNEQAKLEQVSTNLLQAKIELVHVNKNLLHARVELEKINKQLDDARNAKEKLGQAKLDQARRRDFLSYVIGELCKHQMEVKCLEEARASDLRLEFVAKDNRLTISTASGCGNDWPANRPLFKELVKTIAALEQKDMEVREFVFAPSPCQVVEYSDGKLTIKPPRSN